MTQTLAQHLCHHVADPEGWMPFSAFMHAALYAENLGYYTNPATVFGADFVTAPEISPLFSHTLAKAVLPVLSSMHSPQILEFGAGRGIMAADILVFLEKANSLPEAYHIVEVSPHLQKTQQETLKKHAAHLVSKVHWHTEPPAQFSGVVLANEVLDALPAERWVMHQGAPHFLGVRCQNLQFDYALGKPFSVHLPYPEYPEGYISEVCPQADDFVASLGRMLQQGLLLLIDYGYEDHEYFHPERNTGTLKCFHRHHHHDDPFIHLGAQDISVHANFSAVSRAAEKAGLMIEDYQTQAQFLLAHGIAELASGEDLAQTETRLKVSKAIQTLTLPGQMGDVVKVLTLSKGLGG